MRSTCASLLVIAATGAQPRPLEASTLSVDGLYYAVGRPLTVTVDGPAALALMDADGHVLAPPLNVGAGRFDLGEALPEIWSIRRACYLQGLAGGVPDGAALVLQPMLEPPTARTEAAVRPDGSPYTRIAGWGPPQEPGAGDAQPPLPVFSGLRVYAERDVVLRTSLGDIVLAMRPDEAPNTVWNFLRLVEGGFYDGVVFHRVVPFSRDGHPFVIQAGDPTGEGDGGPGYRIPMEPSAVPHDFGVISMARADDPDSAGSQFFICLSRRGTARLDGQYCAFGHAVEGAGVIEAIGAVELADPTRGRPVDPPVIGRAWTVPAPPRIPGRGRPDRPVSPEEAPPEVEIDRPPR